MEGRLSDMARKSRKPQGLTADAAVAAVKPKYSTAIYTRLSVEDNNLDDGNSIETQKDILLSFVEAQADMTLYGVYCDNGFTGSNFDRNDFIRMMDDVKCGKVNAIVVRDLSEIISKPATTLRRFSRLWASGSCPSTTATIPNGTIPAI